MDANTVGFRYNLRQGETFECECDKPALVRITEKSGVGISYGYYCKECLPEPVVRDKPVTA